MREYVFLILVALIITYAATPAIRMLAEALDAFTPVRDRDVHSEPIPRLGGVSMFLGFGAALVATDLLVAVGFGVAFHALVPAARLAGREATDESG